jgi:hypothetical protein
VPAPAPAPAAVGGGTESAATAAREDLDRFKEALKALVRQGMMTREQAKAAWQARVQGGAR